MRLAVVGSINTDMTVTAERIPLKGETLMGSSLSYIPGGKGANQAVAMAKLGAEVEMFGCVGDDSNGEKIAGESESSRSRNRTYPDSERRSDGDRNDYGRR
mgnify:CR=1 FL=1